MHDILSPESDADMLYHERVGPELTRQVWNLADEDIDGDFPIIPEQYPSVYVNPAQGLQDSFNCIIRWILLVLCLWSSFCVISDNASCSRYWEFCCIIPKIIAFIKETTWN